MDIISTIQDLIAESERPKKSRVQDVSQLINKICDHANQSGLRNEALRSIIELVREPSTLDQTSITTLIKSLYPAQRIPSSHVSLVVAALGPAEKKPSPATQNLLLWWLALVRTALEEWNVLERLYSILFNLLDMMTIRTNLCRLLCLITRRKHVKPWRVHRLHELSQSASNDQALNALLKVYRNFYPDVIVPQGKSMEMFKGLDKEWIARLNAIQEQNDVGTGPAAAYENVQGGSKRRRTDVIPRVQTRQVHENTVVLEELRTIEDFGNKYERIEYPTQIIAALDNQQLQWLVVLRDDPALHERLDDWLSMFLDAHMQKEMDENHTDGPLGEVLGSLSIFAKHTKIVPRAFRDAFSEYAGQWDGNRHQSSILGILEHLEFKSYEEYQYAFLDKLEEALIDGTETMLVKILLLYNKLIRSWTASLMVTPSKAKTPSPEDSGTITDFVSHCSNLVLQLLASGPSSTAQAAIHEYFHTVANISALASRYPRLKINIPSTHQTYLAFFTSPSIYTLSSVGSILSLYRDILDQSPGHNDTRRDLQIPQSSVAKVDGYATDLCNLLWKDRAFTTTDKNAKGCLLNRNMTKTLQKYIESIPIDRRYSLGALMSLSFHPALSAISIQVFRDMEDKVIADNSDEEDVITERHAGPVTQRSLAHLISQGGLEVSWINYRKEVLDVLAAMGADGLSELIEKVTQIP